MLPKPGSEPRIKRPSFCSNLVGGDLRMRAATDEAAARLTTAL